MKTTGILAFAAVMLLSGLSVFAKKEKSSCPSIKRCLDRGIEFTLKAEEIGRVQGDTTHYVAQGACTDGRNVYFTLRTKGNDSAVIYKYRLSPFKFIAKSEPIACHHANDITWCDASGTLVVAHGGPTKMLTIVDASTLKEIGKQSIAYNCGAISYCSARGQYVASSGAGAYRIADADFNDVSGEVVRAKVEGKTAQGNGNDGTFIYFPMSGQGRPVMDTYRWDDGSHVATLDVPVHLEIESCFVVGDRYFAVFYGGKAFKGAILYELLPERAFKNE